MRPNPRLWFLVTVLLLTSFLLAACVSSGGGGTPVPVPGNKITPALNDNSTTAPMPFPPEIAETMTAQAKSGFVASTPVP